MLLSFLRFLVVFFLFVDCEGVRQFLGFLFSPEEVVPNRAVASFNVFLGGGEVT